MTQAMTSIQIDIRTRQELKALKGERTYDDLLLEMVKIYKGRIERNRFRTPEKIMGMRQALANLAQRRIKLGKNGRIKEIDLSD